MFFIPIPPDGFGLPSFGGAGAILKSILASAGPIFLFVPSSALLIAFNACAAALDGLDPLSGFFFLTWHFSLLSVVFCLRLKSQ